MRQICDNCGFDQEVDPSTTHAQFFIREPWMSRIEVTCKRCGDVEWNWLYCQWPTFLDDLIQMGVTIGVQTEAPPEVRQIFQWRR